MPRFNTADGLSLHYSDEGHGPPVLCLAGLTRNGQDFAALAARLARRYRVIRPDMRGRGASDHDPARRYDLGTEAGDVLALLAHLDPGPCVVVGTSRGGLIAMVLAATPGVRLAGVLLNDVGPDLGGAGLDRIMATLGLVPDLPDLDAAAAALAAQTAARFPGVPLARWRDWAAGTLRETGAGLALRYDPGLRDAVLAQAAARQVEEAEGAPPPDLWPLFDALAGVPVAVVRGANSDLLLPETVARMQMRRPDLIAVEVADRGHVPFLDEPSSLAALEVLLARAGAMA